jgi:hypothetical protein
MATIRRKTAHFAYVVALLKTLQVLPRERESSDESDQYQNGRKAPLFRWREIRSRITVPHEPTMVSFHSRSQPKELVSTILRMSDTALQR